MMIGLLAPFAPLFSAGLWLFTLHSRSHRLAVRRTAVGLLQCRSAAMTHKKSPPAPTTAFSPMPEHRRRSGKSYRTRLLFGRSARPRPDASEPVASPADRKSVV